MTDYQPLLAIAATTWRQAQTDLGRARDQLAELVAEACSNGVSQSEASRIVGVDRLTIRKWISQHEDTTE